MFFYCFFYFFLVLLILVLVMTEFWVTFLVEFYYYLKKEMGSKCYLLFFVFIFGWMFMVFDSLFFWHWLEATYDKWVEPVWWPIFFFLEMSMVYLLWGLVVFFFAFPWGSSLFFYDSFLMEKTKFLDNLLVDGFFSYLSNIFFFSIVFLPSWVMILVLFGMNFGFFLFFLIYFSYHIFLKLLMWGMIWRRGFFYDNLGDLRCLSFGEFLINLFVFSCPLAKSILPNFWLFEPFSYWMMLFSFKHKIFIFFFLVFSFFGFSFLYFLKYNFFFLLMLGILFYIIGFFVFFYFFLSNSNDLFSHKGKGKYYLSVSLWVNGLFKEGSLVSFF